MHSSWQIIINAVTSLNCLKSDLTSFLATSRHRIILYPSALRRGLHKFLRRHLFLPVESVLESTDPRPPIQLDLDVLILLRKVLHLPQQLPVLLIECLLVTLKSTQLALQPIQPICCFCVLEPVILQVFAYCLQGPFFTLIVMGNVPILLFYFNCTFLFLVALS